MSEEKKREQQTLKQRIAEAEARLEAMKQRDRKADRLLKNSQKLILGEMLINDARSNPKMRDWLLDKATRSVTRDVDLKQIKPLLDELRAAKDKDSQET